MTNVNNNQVIDQNRRILTEFEPCNPSDGTVILNPPDKWGIQHVAENSTNSASTDFIYRGLEWTDQGPDPTTGNPTTLNGNINKLFLWNNGGQNIDLSADNSVALNTIIRS
ncbi:MAG: hypothetical protein WAM54_09110 [Nitrososphaeraceae archaeon]